MKFKELELPGAYVIDLQKIEDQRGFFARAFCRNEFEQNGLNATLVQCNISYNPVEATLRGMHYQAPPYGEVKSVRCTAGAIYDVIVDVRRHSHTYCKWIGIELTASNRRMLYVPEGFAHGYLTLTSETEVFYQVSECYRPEAERGARWDDPAFRIEWPMKPKMLSLKDAAHPIFVK